MKRRIPRYSAKWLLLGAVLLVTVIGWMSRHRWSPAASGWVQRSVAAFRPGSEAQDAHGGEHAGHDHGAHSGHDHAGHDEASSLEVSAQGLRNIGLSAETIQPVRLETFRKSITVPAVVVERPGRTQVQVATPMTGVVTHVHAVLGEAVEPGTLLFQIRLTHEDLVQAQTEFLKTLGELDVEKREIARLTEVTQSGAVAGKVLLEREYARDKLSALLQAQREALRLHGLSDGQIDQITQERRLLRELRIYAPSIDEHDADELELTTSALDSVSLLQEDAVPAANELHAGPLVLQTLNVHKGQSVTSGETLCILADYGELYIEGMAFEQDIVELRQASQQGWTVDALFEKPGTGSRIVEGLEIAFLSNQVDPVSRTLHFYVRLPNEITKDRRTHGHRYVEWKFLPGQRLQLRVPVEEWPDQIVLPVDAIAREGAESFVFQQNGDHFDRVPVHVTYRDQHQVVVANDGSLFPGDVVAMTGAHQLQMALKNKSGGGVDPHAGHNH